MLVQLRVYTINRGVMDEWVEEWHAHIKPLRLKLGFEILGAWTVTETNQFLWVLSYDGPESWDSLDQAYHQSKERRAMEPDPARHIARMEHFFMNPVS